MVGDLLSAVIVPGKVISLLEDTHDIILTTAFTEKIVLRFPDSGNRVLWGEVLVGRIRGLSSYNILSPRNSKDSRGDLEMEGRRARVRACSLDYHPFAY